MSNISAYGYGLGNLHKIGPSSYGTGIGIFVGDIGVIQANVDLQWGVQSTTGGAVDLLWDISEFISSDVSLPWNVLLVTGDETQLVWDVSQTTITRDASFPWNIFTFFGTETSFRWRIFTAAGGEFELLWDTAQAIFLTTTETRYSIEEIAADWFNIGHDHYEFPRAIILVDKEDQGFTEEDLVTIILPDLSPAEIKKIIDTIRIRSEKSE